MPQIVTYANNAELPDQLGCQIRAFIRIMWFDSYKFDLDQPVLPDEWHPVYVLVLEKHALISHAAVVWRYMEHGEQTYKVFGLSSVFTYPAFRGQHYGSQVVQAATKYIEQQADADMAILYTDPELQGFYGQWGWEVMNDTTIHTAKKDEPSIYDAFTMMLFLTDKGKQARLALEHDALYVGEETW